MERNRIERKRRWRKENGEGKEENTRDH